MELAYLRKEDLKLLEEKNQKRFGMTQNTMLQVTEFHY